MFLGVCAHKFGPEIVEQCCNALQTGLLSMVIVQVHLDHVLVYSRPQCCSVGCLSLKRFSEPT
jgi:hypothetical protein